MINSVLYFRTKFIDYLSVRVMAHFVRSLLTGFSYKNVLNSTIRNVQQKSNIAKGNLDTLHQNELLLPDDYRLIEGYFRRIT